MLRATTPPPGRSIRPGSTACATERSAFGRTLLEFTPAAVAVLADAVLDAVAADALSDVRAAARPMRSRTRWLAPAVRAVDAVRDGRLSPGRRCSACRPTRGYWLMPVLYTAADLDVRPCEARRRVSRRHPGLCRGRDRLRAAGGRRPFRRVAHGDRDVRGVPALHSDSGMGVRAAEGRASAEGTIVGADMHLTGNLRGAFPRVRASWTPRSRPTPSPGRGQMARALRCGASPRSTRSAGSR